MNQQLIDVSKNMRELGLAALAHANRHTAFYDELAPRMNELAILHAAHAAEIIFKSRIAEEHPLLIFEKLPEFKKSNSKPLDMEQLLVNGRTIEWSKIPEVLWATTGIVIPDMTRFNSFGKLRNGLQHFGFINNSINAPLETLHFIYNVIDPFINSCWNLHAVDYNEGYDPLFISSLLLNEIDFSISPSLKKYYEEWEESLGGEYDYNFEMLKGYIEKKLKSE